MYKTIQLKKKMTRLKISHFLKKNRLVLFLHYNIQNINSRGAPTTPNQLLSNESTNLLLIKNRIAQKLVLAQLSRKTGALFHGPSALLGIIDIARLVDILKIYKQQDAFFLFGGLYDSQILSHTQIEKLAILSQKQENLCYLELVNCLQKPTLKALFTFQNCTPFSNLKKLQYGLIEIFNFRNNQLLIQSNREDKVFSPRGQ